jgi:1-acyl-sn-glycerol-3-phosphate acyltransferase
MSSTTPTKPKTPLKPSRMGLIYRFIRLLVTAAVKIFFSEVQVLGLENLPQKGPIIVVGNHKNQFVDPMIVVTNLARPISFLIAEKSMHRRVIGDLARLMNAIPVIRPQDRAREGKGQISSYDAESFTLTCTENVEQEIKPGELIALKGYTRKNAPLVVSSVSQNKIIIKGPVVKPEDEADGTGGQPTTLEISSTVAYKIIPKISQAEVFQRVYESLARGDAIGIFPEGGSSDRTDLLPLKAGVSVMALGAADEGTDVKMVPFGINYTRGHRWRSRIVVDVGKPVSVDPTHLKLFREGNKRDAYAAYLKDVEKALRGVTLNAPDMRSLQILRTMRRMYQGNVKLTPKRYMELSRRFAAAFTQFKNDDRFIELVEGVHDYMNETSKRLVTDRQVAAWPPVGSVSASGGALVRLLVDVGIFLLGSLIIIPNMIPFLPTLFRVNHVVNVEVHKALAGSSVKVKGEDVAASQKIMGTFIWLPINLISALIILGLAMGLTWPKSLPSPLFPSITSDGGGAGDWIFLNLPWIVPVAFLLIFPFYGYVMMLIGERALRARGRMMSHVWLAIAIGRKKPSSTTAGTLRERRKDLALKIQTFFVKIVIPSIPEWKADPIIDFTLIQDNRRPSDYNRAQLVAKQVEDMMSNTNNTTSAAVTPTSPKGPARTTVISLKGSMQNLDMDKVASAFVEEDENPDKVGGEE